MIADAQPLPDDIELLKKLVLEALQELARSQDANANENSGVPRAA